MIEPQIGGGGLEPPEPLRKENKSIQIKVNEKETQKINNYWGEDIPVLVV